MVALVVSFMVGMVVLVGNGVVVFINCSCFGCCSTVDILGVDHKFFDLTLNILQKHLLFHNLLLEVGGRYWLVVPL